MSKDLDYPSFMYGLMYAEFERTDCKKCSGLGAVAEMCCDGRECGCQGMPVDFKDCDCGIPFPSDEQILKWESAHVSKPDPLLDVPLKGADDE